MASCEAPRNALYSRMKIMSKSFRMSSLKLPASHPGSSRSVLVANDLSTYDKCHTAIPEMEPALLPQT